MKKIVSMKNIYVYNSEIKCHLFNEYNENVSSVLSIFFLMGVEPSDEMLGGVEGVGDTSDLCLL